MVEKRTITRLTEKGKEPWEDTLLWEGSLQISFGDLKENLSCTGTSLKELATGFLYTEKRVDVSHCSFFLQEKIPGRQWRLSILGEGIPLSFEETAKDEKTHGEGSFSTEEIFAYLEEFQKNSQLFTDTGNMHSAMFLSWDGETKLFTEDIGRHNALDKLIGAALFREVNLAQGIIFLSGRVPKDMMKKLQTVQAKMVVSVSAATADSVEMAKEAKMTLIGFARRGRMNVYTGQERIADATGRYL